jgi:hypothetical protein
VGERTPMQPASCFSSGHKQSLAVGDGRSPASKNPRPITLEG